MTDKLKAETFDRVVAGKAEKLWGAPAIAQAIGLSTDTVRKWAREVDVPIYQPRPRCYFARRSELEAWLRQKPSQPIRNR